VLGKLLTRQSAKVEYKDVRVALGNWLNSERPQSENNPTPTKEDPLAFITGVQKPDWWVDS